MSLDDQLKGEDETLDTFYHGRIRVFQKKKGYRFSIDAPLLADFIQTKETDRILELGTGNGIVSLLLSIKPFSSLTAVEIQASLADLARRNVRLNNCEDRIHVIHTDLRVFSEREKYDVVFSNPPYIKRNTGHLSESDEKSVAKHELKCTISDIMQKTEELLATQGVAYYIYPATREKDFMRTMEEMQLRIRNIRYVYPQKGSAPNFFLVSMDFDSLGAQKLRPLILYEKKGDYTAEAQEIFTGRIHDPAD
ncbi:MAG: methyltransferase [Candidatus Aminicenantes bacterium]|jgi:tRNA1(Val) A37 N6-methylase TrmN6